MTKNNDEKYPNIGGEGQEEQVKRQEIASLETEGSVELKFPTEQRAERGNEIMSGFGWSPFDIGEMVGEKDIWNQYRAEKYYPKSVGNSIRSKVHEFRTKILSQFIAEEFEIQQLSSNNERNDDLRFANVISSIMRSGDHQDQYSNSNWRSEFGGWRDDVKSKRDKNIAVLLKNLVGRYGTVDGTPLFLALAASSDPDSSYRPIDRADQNFLPKH